MSNNDNRDLFGRDTGAQSELLDELDSLKELLREQEQGLVGNKVNGDVDIPMLDEIVDIPMLDEVIDTDAIEPEAAAEVAESSIPVLDEVAGSELLESAIPVLEEVAFPPDEPQVVHAEPQPPQSATTAESTLPSERELSKLIDMLVGHRLRRLRPKIKEEVIEELQRLYPELFQQ